MPAPAPQGPSFRSQFVTNVGSQMNFGQALGMLGSDAILEEEPRTRFVHLHGSRQLLESRMQHRQGHFMPSSLLESQFDILESLQPDEPGIVVEIDQTPEQIVDAAAALLG